MMGSKDRRSILVEVLELREKAQMDPVPPLDESKVEQKFRDLS
jgi:hypothetical protein